jgi:hypothetical protein
MRLGSPTSVDLILNMKRLAAASLFVLSEPDGDGEVISIPLFLEYQVQGITAPTIFCN